MFKFLDKLALNKGLMLLLCSITLALLCVELCVAVKRGRLYARKVVTTAAQAIVIVAVMTGIGFLLSLLPLQGVGGILCRSGSGACRGGGFLHSGRAQGGAGCHCQCAAQERR